MRIAYCMALFVALGCTNDTSEIGAVCAPVVGGRDVTDASPVIRLGGCSAVLIAPDVALTAAHCHEAGFDDGVQFVSHPEYRSDLALHDIAIAILPEPRPGQPAALIAEPQYGEATIQGYGSGELQEATVTIERINETALVASPADGSACNGDSGGGLFIEGWLVGIVYGSSVDCSGDVHAVPVVEHLHWISNVVSELGC